MQTPQPGVHAVESGTTDSQALFALRFQQFDAIQPLSVNTIKLLKACQQPQADVDHLVRIIESDPAMATRILLAANSPLYGYAREIGSIGHAIVVLGMRAIARLAAAFATDKLFHKSDSTKSTRLQLYHHSLGCASVARVISDMNRRADPGEAFLGGILHDVGKLVFLDLVPEQYSIMAASAPRKATTQMERDVFGVDHAQVGQVCAERWGLPKIVGLAIAHHHHPHQANGAAELAGVIEAANQLANEIGFGYGKSDLPPETPANAMVDRLSASARESLIETAKSEYEVIVNAG